MKLFNNIDCSLIYLKFIKENVFFLSIALIAFSSSLLILLYDFVGYLSQFRLIDFINVGAYVSGFFFGVIAAFKMKEYNEFPEKVSLYKPVILTLISSILISLPTFLAPERFSNCFGFNEDTTQVEFKK